MITIDREQAAKLIAETNGLFFSAEFTKKNKELRKMCCRTGVHKFTKGGKSTIAGIDNLVGVWDVQIKDYRCIPLDTLHQIKAFGNVYKIGVQ